MVQIKEMDGELSIVVTHGNRITVNSLPPGADENQVNELLADAVRGERDALLGACDWTRMDDCPIGEGQREAWRAYRQALRDIPQQAGFPHEVEWPEKPE